MAFMEFKIGPDLAICLIKSIFFALLSVFLLMPGLLVLFAPLMDKTQHRDFIPKVPFVGKFAYKTRRVIPPIFLLVIVGAAILSFNCPYAYGKANIETPKKNDTQIAKEMIEKNFSSSNMVALVVPCGDHDAEKAILNELDGYAEVDHTVGLCNSEAMDGYMLTDKLTPRQFSELTDLDYEAAQLVYAAYATENEEYGKIVGGISTYSVPLMDMFLFVHDQIEDGYVSLDADQQREMDDAYDKIYHAKLQLDGEAYSRMLVYLDLPLGSDTTYAFLDTIRDSAKSYYPDGNVYVVGNATTEYDFEKSFSRDNAVVSIVSILIVLVVLLFTFRSAAMPILLILVIQGSIWINFAIPAITGNEIFFMSYLVVSSIQMGANIDYAIVIASRFSEQKVKMSKQDAIIETMNFAFPTIITSGTCMAAAGILISNLTSDGSISLLTLLGLSSPALAAITLAEAPISLGYEADTGDSESTCETIYLSDADDVLAFAKACALDSYSKDKRFVLGADVSLANSSFLMIPVFCGIFDGGGHTISGLTLCGSSHPTGLFGIVESGAVVMDLSVSGTIAPTGEAGSVGGIAGINRGTLTNCSFTGTVTGKSSSGGIVGVNEAGGVVTGCSTFGGVFGQHATGGIAGTNEGLIRLCQSACYVNTASVDPSVSVDVENMDLTQSFAQFAATDSLSASTDTGGIVGYSAGTVRNCVNTGAVGYRHIGYNVGGVVGRSCGYLAVCQNTGAVCGRKDVGGIVGQMEPYVDTSLSKNLLAELEEELNELNAAVDKAINDADDSVQTASARLNKMADYMAEAAAAVGNLKAYASMVSTATGSASYAGSGSADASAPSVSVSVDPDTGVEISSSASAEGESAGSAGALLSANSKITVNASQYKLSAALSGMTNELRLLNGEMSDASTTISDDVRAINELAGKIADTATELYTAVETMDADSLITDASDVNIGAVTKGKVVSCHNTGCVYGDIDVGGIAGSMAIEYEPDPEDDITNELSKGTQSRYELKAILQSCINEGEIGAKRDCVGGICGRMDLGLILSAENCGDVTSESGSYVGGVAGLSKSVIRNCYANCTLTGSSYLGGVIGCGSDADEQQAGSVTEGCRTLVSIAEDAHYAGAIAGSEAGEYTDDRFVSDTLAGLGKASYLGRAEPISYAALLNEITTPLSFRSFTLRFVADDATIKTVRFQYGDSFDASVFPAIPAKEGYYASWDTDELKDLHFDTLVLAIYTPYISALASEELRGNERPILLAEGSFVEGDALSLTAKAKTPREFSELSNGLKETLQKYFSCFERGELPASYICREIVEQWEIELPSDGASTHTLRYLSPDESAADLKVYCKRDGEWRELPAETIGSYLVFSVEGEHAELAVLSILPVWWIWLLAAALLLLLLLCILRGILQHKRKKAAAKAAQADASPADPSVGSDEGESAKAQAQPPKRKRKNHLLRALLLILLLLCCGIGCLLFLRTDLGTGLEAMHLLHTLYGKETLSMELAVDADVDGRAISTQANVGWITKDDQRICRVESSGVSLYYANDTVYLSSGKGYRASELFPDLSLLIERAGEIAKYAKVSCSTENGSKRYTFDAEGADARALAKLLLPAYTDQFLSVDQMELTLTAVNGSLTALRFCGGGTLSGADGGTFSIDAALTVLQEDAFTVPQAVFDAVSAGEQSGAELGEATFRLLKALSESEAQQTLCAKLQLSADCGPLLLNTELWYF